MGRSSGSIKSMPPSLKFSVVNLGNDLRIIRERRGKSLRAWSAMMDISVPTLQRMEKGDPKVSIGSYATALWLAGYSERLSELAAPEFDREALLMDINKSKRSRL